MPTNLLGNNEKSRTFPRSGKVRDKNGVTVVEILVMIFIFGIAMSALFALVSFGLRSSDITQQTVRATALAQEAMEAARSFRDTTDWSVDGLGTLALGTDYHPELQGATPDWKLISGAETIDGFTRKIVLEEVQRDAADNIVESGGTVDPNTKKITITVIWQEHDGTRDFQLTGYLTNWR